MADLDDLDALFDSIAYAGGAPGIADKPAAAAAPVAPAKPSEPLAASPEKAEMVYSRLGALARNLHDALSELGVDRAVEHAAEVMPDMRDRLNYISTMTEKAAQTVLDTVDHIKPLQETLTNQARDLRDRWDLAFKGDLSLEEFKALSGETRSYMQRAYKDIDVMGASLMDIVLAQDFQDLTGQMIRKITGLARQVEEELVKLLIELTGDIHAGDKVRMHEEELHGPVVGNEQHAVASSQGEVDDLLSSLGF